jgi:hypothetical protein
MESAVRSPQSAGPERALEAIADELRGGGTLVAECVVETRAEPTLGRLAAAGPRAAETPGAYAQVVESVREGFLLHYGRPRVVRTEDRDLALLAGDYLYARGLALLAELGDLDAVRVLAELIALCAHAPAGAEADVAALWLAGATAVTAGDEPGHAEGKEAFRAGESAAERLWVWTAGVAAREGLEEQLGAAAETVGFRATERTTAPPDTGDRQRST